MGEFGKRFTLVDMDNGDVKRVLISEDMDAEGILVVAEPTGPDGVFVIQCKVGATQRDVELMTKALCDEKIPYIQQQF